MPPAATRWARCIALTTLLVGAADFVQNYLLFTAFRDRPIIGVFQGPPRACTAVPRSRVAFVPPRSSSSLEVDQGRYLGYCRVVGRRRPGAQLDEPVTSVAVEYYAKPLLRSGILEDGK